MSEELPSPASPAGAAGPGRAREGQVSPRSGKAPRSRSPGRRSRGAPLEVNRIAAPAALPNPLKTRMRSVCGGLQSSIHFPGGDKGSCLWGLQSPAALGRRQTRWTPESPFLSRLKTSAFLCWLSANSRQAGRQRRFEPSGTLERPTRVGGHTFSRAKARFLKQFRSREAGSEQDPGGGGQSQAKPRSFVLSPSLPPRNSGLRTTTLRGGLGR